jgi:hypothetical protein
VRPTVLILASTLTCSARQPPAPASRPGTRALALAAAPQAPSPPVGAPGARGRPHAGAGKRLARGREHPTLVAARTAGLAAAAAGPATYHHRRRAGQVPIRSGSAQQVALPAGMGAGQRAAHRRRRRWFEARSRSSAAVLLAALLAALLLVPLAAADEQEGEHWAPRGCDAMALVCCAACITKLPPLWHVPGHVPAPLPPCCRCLPLHPALCPHIPAPLQMPS